MNDSNAKIAVYMCIFILSLLFVLSLITLLSQIPQCTPSNWEECTGTIIANDNNNLLISYEENGNTYYYYKYNTVSNSTSQDKQEYEINDTMKLFYYKRNPEKVSDTIQDNIELYVILTVICFMFLMIPVIVAFKSFRKPTNGIKEHLKLVETTGSSQLNSVDYHFLWEKDGKQKYLTSLFGPRDYSDIIDITGIDSIICYIKNEKTNNCYADFNETFEENNIVYSSNLNSIFKI